MLVSQDVSGPVPAQRRHTRSAFRTATPVLSVEEGQRALVASLKSLQQPRRGDGRVKRRPLRGAPLSIPSRPLLPDLPSPSYLPMRPKRPGTMLDHCAWPTDQPTPSGSCSTTRASSHTPRHMRPVLTTDLLAGGGASHPLRSRCDHYVRTAPVTARWRSVSSSAWRRRHCSPSRGLGLLDVARKIAAIRVPGWSI
jgi:hypothetical protein